MSRSTEDPEYKGENAEIEAIIESIRAALVLAVAYFVMVWIGKSERREVLRTHIVETAKRIYGAPEFFYYAHPCTASRRAPLVGYRGRNPEAVHALREVERETRLEEGARETVTAT